MKTTENSLGLQVTVRGTARKYEFTDKESGEIVNLLKIDYPGGSASVNLSPEKQRLIQEGSAWHVEGPAAVSKNGIRITRVTAIRQLTIADQEEAEVELLGATAANGKR